MGFFFTLDLSISSKEVHNNVDCVAYLIKAHMSFNSDNAATIDCVL